MDESALIERARAGSSEAFTGLVGLYQSRVRAFLSRYIRSDDLADDLAQEAFLNAFRNLGSFRPESSFGAWLIAIARNQALLHLRTEKRRRGREERSVRSALDRRREELLRTSAWVASREDRKIAALDECLERLPGRSAEIVNLHYREGVKSVEIARETGKSDAWVRVTLHRIRQALRRCIEQRAALEPR